MIYANELSFLRDVFRKSRISADVIDLSEWQYDTFPQITDDLIDRRILFRELFPTLRSCTVYRLTDSFECCYRFILLPDTQTTKVLCIGPYLSAPLTAEDLLEIGEINGVPPQKQTMLAEIYASMTVLSSDSPLFTVLHTFCERIWHGPAYSVKDIEKYSFASDSPFSKTMLDFTPSDTLIRMKTMEHRYALENEMIQAVMKGHIHMEGRLFSLASDMQFEKRLPDALRNAKNYCIIMNTLLRKAAEQGGVHPLQIDRVSSEFAANIENMSSLSENAALMRNMFLSYCRLVRDHSLRKFSSPVKQTVLMIDADLSAELSPGKLSSSLGISLGYLCSIFKKETGKTLSAYIRERRIEYAAYLLGTTDLQIQTVALHCGIMDVQYFSKIFKRELGVTPTEYRSKRVKPSTDKLT